MTQTLDYESIKWEDLIKESDEIDFVVSDEQFKKVLQKIGNNLDNDGFIIDSITKNREKSKDQDDIRLKELGGLLTGSKIFVKRNIASFSEHLIEKKLRTK